MALPEPEAVASIGVSSLNRYRGGAQMADLFFEHNHLRAKNVSSLAVVCSHLRTSYLFNEDTPMEATASGSGIAIF
jgi:hypothetical protein